MGSADWPAASTGHTRRRRRGAGRARAVRRGWKKCSKRCCGRHREKIRRWPAPWHRPPPPRPARPGARRPSAVAGLPAPRPARGGAPPGRGRRPCDRSLAPRRRARRVSPAHGRRAPHHRPRRHPRRRPPRARPAPVAGGTGFRPGRRGAARRTGPRGSRRVRRHPAARRRHRPARLARRRRPAAMATATEAAAATAVAAPARRSAPPWCGSG